jgi:hypothetical protein
MNGQVRQWQTPLKCLCRKHSRLRDVHSGAPRPTAARRQHNMQVSLWLGHATYSLTLDVYGDYMPEADGGAVNTLPSQRRPGEAG